MGRGKTGGEKNFEASGERGGSPPRSPGNFSANFETIFVINN